MPQKRKEAVRAAVQAGFQRGVPEDGAMPRQRRFFFSVFIVFFFFFFFFFPRVPFGGATFALCAALASFCVEIELAVDLGYSFHFAETSNRKRVV